MASQLSPLVTIITKHLHFVQLEVCQFMAAENFLCRLVKHHAAVDEANETQCPRDLVHHDHQLLVDDKHENFDAECTVFAFTFYPVLDSHGHEKSN